MRKFATAAVALVGAFAGATPAFAGTLQEVIAKGMTITIQGTEVPVTFSADKTFSAMDGQVTGTWRTDGDNKLCTSSNLDVNEMCLEYPTDKKSGDTFEVASPQGPIAVRIN